MEESDKEDHNTTFRLNLRYFLLEGIASQVMFTLLAIPFISLYLVSIGADPSLIGFVAAIPYISNLVQLPSSLFVEKFDRKRVLIFANLFSRLPLLFVAVFFLIDGNYALFVFVALFTVYNVFKEISNVAWNSWMRDLIPIGMRGKLFSTRLAYGKFAALGVTSIFILIFGIFNKFAFFILFLSAFVAGMLSLAFVSKIDNVTIKSKRKNLKSILNGNFAKLTASFSIWKFATEISLPFFSVYIVTILKYPAWFVIALISLSQLSSIYFLRISGKIMDRFGSKPVTILSFLTFSLACILFTFTTMPRPHPLTPLLLILIYLLDGFYSSIPGVALGNMIAKITQKGNSAPCYAINNVTMSVCGAAGSIVGGLLASLLISANFVVKIDIESSLGFVRIPIIYFSSYDFLFIISAILSVIAAKTLRHFKERGETSEEIVKKEIKSAMLHDVQSLVTYTIICHRRINGKVFTVIKRNRARKS